MRRVEFRPAALADLEDLFEYIAKDDPQTAIGFVQRIRRRCERLKEFPEAAPLREDLRPGLRLLAFERRVVVAYIYANDVVSIGRVLYGGRDVEALVGKMD